MQLQLYYCFSTVFTNQFLIYSPTTKACSSCGNSFLPSNHDDISACVEVVLIGDFSYFTPNQSYSVLVCEFDSSNIPTRNDITSRYPEFNI